MLSPCSNFIGSLQRARLEKYHPPFTFTRVGLFGALIVEYGCLFTCLTTRAVNLEVTPSLGADDFIIVLQFIGRKGPHMEIWFDRGTNFVQANRDLKEAIVH